MEKYQKQFKERKNLNHMEIEYLLGYLKELTAEVRKLKNKYTGVMESTIYHKTKSVYNMIEKTGKLTHKPLAELWDIAEKMSKDLDKIEQSI